MNGTYINHIIWQVQGILAEMLGGKCVFQKKMWCLWHLYLIFSLFDSLSLNIYICIGTIFACVTINLIKAVLRSYWGMYKVIKCLFQMSLARGTSSGINGLCNLCLIPRVRLVMIISIWLPSQVWEKMWQARENFAKRAKNPIRL